VHGCTKQECDDGYEEVGTGNDTALTCVDSVTAAQHRNDARHALSATSTAGIVLMSLGGAVSFGGNVALFSSRNSNSNSSNPFVAAYGGDSSPPVGGYIALGIGGGVMLIGLSMWIAGR
jgi:hypothetical protein